MKLTVEEVTAVANLACLALEEDEKERLTGHLNQILEHFAELQKLDTSDVEPTDRVLPMVNVYRADEVKPSLPREEILAAGPLTNYEAFIVPRVVDSSDGKSA
ncbi:MAG: Asp-tRNA(Asn)/Glu-tRNA(Gln) amidotransferase subunit GatC [Armatimonadetes bacterium]|nr:Asp-tRNA(Asn)/Glu-tRNA(Gln) amidotransferase subunit GatC [Armatimonadota bacterium]